MRDIFSFDVTGIDVMIAKLDQLSNEMEKKLDDALTECAQLVVEDARALAPKDEGILIPAINESEVKKTLHQRYIEIGISPEAAAYATRMHEDFYTPSDSEKQKPYKGHMPGRKYLENAIKLNEKKIIEILTEALRLG